MQKKNVTVFAESKESKEVAFGFVKGIAFCETVRAHLVTIKKCPDVGDGKTILALILERLPEEFTFKEFRKATKALIRELYSKKVQCDFSNVAQYITRSRK